MTNKFDSNEVAFLELQLQELAKDRAVEVEYRELQALNFVPSRASSNPGISTFAYYELDVNGDEAKWLASNADDVSLVDVSAAKQVSSLYRSAKGFTFNMDELQEEQIAQMGLIERRRNAARSAVMRHADKVAAFGDVQKGLKGLANHPNVPVMSAAAAAAGGNTKPWNGADKTPMEVLNDMFDLAEKVELQTDGNHKCNTILLPLEQYLFVSRTVLDAGGTNSDSILTAFKKNKPGVEVLSWNKLDNADAAGTGPRAIAYEKSADNMEFLIADPLSEDPVREAGARRFEVVMTMKFGGVIMYRPLCVAYMDNI
jgi:hypothetical protein